MIMKIGILVSTKFNDYFANSNLRLSREDIPELNDIKLRDYRKLVSYSLFYVAPSWKNKNWQN